MQQSAALLPGESVRAEGTTGSRRRASRRREVFFLPPTDDPRRGAGGLPLDALRRTVEGLNVCRVVSHEELLLRPSDSWLDSADAALVSRVIELRSVCRSVCVFASAPDDVLLLTPVFARGDFFQDDALPPPGVGEEGGEETAPSRRPSVFACAVAVARELRRLEAEAKIVFLFVGVRASLAAPQPTRVGEQDAEGEGPGRREAASCADPGASSSASLLEQLDACECELLLEYNADCLDTAGEEAAALALLRFARAVGEQRQDASSSGGVNAACFLPKLKRIPLAASALSQGASEASASSELLRRVWELQLMQLPGVSPDVARAVALKFPSPAALCARARREEAASVSLAEAGPTGSSPPRARRRRRAGEEGSLQRVVADDASQSRASRALRREVAKTALVEALAEVSVPGRNASRKLGTALATRIADSQVFSGDPEAFV